MIWEDKHMREMYEAYGRQAAALETRREEIAHGWRMRCPSEQECKRYTLLGDMLAEVEWARRAMLGYVKGN